MTERRPVGAALAGWILVGLSPCVFGLLFSPGAWYQSLAKPGWTPPPWLFGPVWTTLYVGMGVAAWLVWRQPESRPRSRALGLFVGQLALNAAWSPIFFGLRRPDLALIEIACLVVVVTATILTFRRVQPTAALLLVPYLGWISFATALNGAIWWLNRGGSGGPSP